MTSIAIIGAGPGLGAAVARRFGKEGFAVALIARTKSKLDQIAGALIEDGIEARGYTGDVRDRESLTGDSGAKEAVAAFAKVLAAELLPRQIRVNSIAPGFILTPTMGVASLTEEERAEFIEQGNASTPMGRGGTMEEIAATALYLAVDATFTTGVELAVDGGFGQGIGH